MIRVGIISGGPSNEHAVSKMSGDSILKSLARSKTLQGVPIFIDQDGAWHLYGVPSTPQEVRSHIDVAWNALHGEYGEDGKLQQLLENLKIPYTGSTPLASAISMNKRMTKEQVSKLGVSTPKDLVIEDYRKNSDMDPAVYLKEAVQKVFLKFAPPWVVKPVSGGSSLGVFIAKTRTELLEALQKVSETPGDILIEEYITGREASIAVVDDFRSGRPYVSLPIEIAVPKGRFFDYDAKYKHEATIRVPGNFTKEEREKLAKLGKCVHEGLGLRHYSRSDFIISPKGIYFLEVNTSPGMTPMSLLPQALEAGGATMREFVEHVVGLAMKN